MKNVKKYNVLDLFCGCGGLSKGFDKQGFNIVAANDIWDDALKTFELNHKSAKAVIGDIRDSEIRNTLYECFKDTKCDLIIGGPPCQAYSSAGSRDPNDPRGKLFRDYVEIVNYLKPKVFILENVKGMLSMKHYRPELNDKEEQVREKHELVKGKIDKLMLLRKQNKNNPSKFIYTEEDADRLVSLKKQKLKIEKNSKDFQEYVVDMVIREFRNIGYNTEYKLLNSANYGVPQKRERVVFIGVRDPSISIEFPEETHSKENGLPEKKKWATIKESIDDLKDLPEDTEFSQIYTKHNNDFINKIKKTPIGKSIFGNYSDSFFRCDPNEPSRTVKENHGGVFVHYSKDRVMTPRELARLQSFDDTFIFFGSKSSVLKQIGNAVPVGLSEALAKKVHNILDTIENRN